MISSSTWVPRGFAAEFPEKYELDDAEMERITQMAKLELADAKDDLHEAETAQNPQKNLQEQVEIDDDLKEYDLENYDEETTTKTGDSVAFFPGLGASDAQYEENEHGDAFLSLPTTDDMQDDKKELQIYSTDNLVLATRTEDDVSYLDVYVYDDGAGAPDGAEEEPADRLDNDVKNGMTREAHLYVHHDVMLPSFPLCVEWVNFRPGSVDSENSESSGNIGNYAAVGTFDPQIELWNLDCVDAAFPDMILGEPAQNSLAGAGKKKKKAKSSGHVTSHHTDAVLSLAHNKTHRNVLCSTSADTTIKLWDLSSGSAVKSFNKVHDGKTVSSAQWHAHEASILLSGGYNSACAVSDIRVSDEKQMCKPFVVGSGQDVESVRWGAQPEVFYCGTDNGNVYCFDVRTPAKPMWTLHAHDGGISALDVNVHVPGMLVTAAMNEKTVKLWKCSEQKGGPSMVLSRDFDVGNVLTSAFANEPEVAGHLCLGGVTGALKMWDCFSNRSVRATFKDELRALQKAARERANAAGVASRIARKYQHSNNETLMTVEAGGIDDADSDSDEEEGEGMEED